ncbi:interleukin-21 receptor [Dipodomys merriami]|uniref:interleukin-21 receptor n=1 Tax=Dipodomys merriami TaxID=94247 RepID=UPI0038556B23
MPLGWAALLLLLMLQTGWGCSDLSCYTDYLQTITCVLETWTPHPHPLTLTWLDPYGELEDKVTSCSLRRTSRNATHAQYTCRMNVSQFMADDIFSVNATDQSGSSQECGSFVLAYSIKPAPPYHVTAAAAPSGLGNVSWRSDYDDGGAAYHPLRHRLQYQLQLREREGAGARRAVTALVSVDARSASLPPGRLRPGRRYELRVRAAAQPGLFQGTWSEWSEPAAFQVPPGGPEANWELLLLLLLAVLATGLVFLGLKTRLPWRLWKRLWAPVPSPRYFFGPLYESHSGDFKKWVGASFTASSLELGSGGPAPSALQLQPAGRARSPPETPPGPPGRDGAPEGGAAGEDGERPYGLVSIDTVTVTGADGPRARPRSDDGYPAAPLPCGCVSARGPGLGGPGPPPGEGRWAAGPPWPSDSEADSPPAGLDMDTFDSGFAGSDCGSPVESDFVGVREEGPPRSYIRQWVIVGSPPAGRDPRPPSQDGCPQELASSSGQSWCVHA